MRLFSWLVIGFLYVPFVGAQDIQSSESASLPELVSKPIEKTGVEEAPQTQIHKGKVLDVFTSVTLKVKSENGKDHDLRLAEIGTPYLNKFHGPESLKALKDLVENKEISYEILGADPKNRKIVKLMVGDLNVNAFMVEKGHAWVSKHFGKSQELLDLQEKAKEARLGIWANGKKIIPKRSKNPRK